MRKVKFLKGHETITHKWSTGAVCEIQEQLAHKLYCEGVIELLGSKPQTAVEPRAETAVKPTAEPAIPTVRRGPGRARKNVQLERQLARQDPDKQ